MKLLKKVTVLVLLSFVMISHLFAQGLFSVSIPERERCLTESSDPFTLDLVTDITLGTLSAGTFITSLVIKTTADFPRYNPATIYDKSTVNAFDRWAMNPYNYALDKTADVGVALGFAVPVLTFGLEAAFGNLPVKSLLDVGVMYAEAFMLSFGIRSLLKMSVLRPRPYMYFDSKDSKGIAGDDWQFSWPSGHSSNVFMATTFLSYVFCQYYPNSAWKIPVVAFDTLLAVGTGVLRLLSGNHYLTDVLSGAAIGAACGFLVPFVHHLVAKHKAQASASAPVALENVGLLPNGFVVTLSFKK